MGLAVPRLHHAEVALRIDHFSHQSLVAETNRRGIVGSARELRRLGDGGRAGHFEQRRRSASDPTPPQLHRPSGPGQNLGRGPVLAATDEGHHARRLAPALRHPERRQRLRAQPALDLDLGPGIELPRTERALARRQSARDGDEEERKGRGDTAQEGHERGGRRQVADEEGAPIRRRRNRGIEARRLDPRASRQGARIDQDPLALDSQPERRHPLGEGRRRGAVLRPVLIAVPRARDAAVDDPALAQRPVLMLADVRERRQPPLVAEDRHALAADRDHGGAPLGDRAHPSRLDEAVPGREGDLAVDPPLAQRRCQVEPQDPRHAESEHGNRRRRPLVLERAQGDMSHHERIGGVGAGVERFPDRRGELGEPEIV